MTNETSDYLSVVYDETRSVRTTYPQDLAVYLCNRFDLKPGERLVEIGCGRGEVLAAFQNCGLVVSGVDREETSQTLSPDKNIKVCDVSSEALPFPDNSMDVVYHKSVIEHVYDPVPLMRETMRVLKPGGKVICLTPDWHSQMAVFYEDFTHCRPYDTMALGDLLKITGFDASHSELFYQLPVLWRHSWLRAVSFILGLFIPVTMARRLTNLTGIKFIRWSCELMVLGYGLKRR
jgi:ubiquinone/menaquinone biosynthesis C-methylase UbiE